MLLTATTQKWLKFSDGTKTHCGSSDQFPMPSVYCICCTISQCSGKNTHRERLREQSGLKILPFFPVYGCLKESNFVDICRVYASNNKFVNVLTYNEWSSQTVIGHQGSKYVADGSTERRRLLLSMLDVVLL